MFKLKGCQSLLLKPIIFVVMGVVLFLISSVASQAEGDDPAFVGNTSFSQTDPIKDTSYPGPNDVYTVKRMAVTTDVVLRDGIKYKRLKDIYDAVVVIEWNGKSHTIIAEKAADILVQKGFFRWVPGLGYAIELAQDKSAPINNEKIEHYDSSGKLVGENGDGGSAGRDKDTTSPGGGKPPRDTGSDSTSDSGGSSDESGSGSGWGNSSGSQARGGSRGGAGQSDQQQAGGGQTSNAGKGKGPSKAKPVVKGNEQKPDDDRGIGLLGQDGENLEFDNRDPNAIAPGGPNRSGVVRGKDMRQIMNGPRQQGESAGGGGSGSGGGSSEIDKNDPASGGWDGLNESDGGGGGSGAKGTSFDDPLN